MNNRDFSDACVWIANSPIIALDVESTGLHPHEWDVVQGIGVANQTHAVYFPLRHPGDENLSYDQARNLIELISQPREQVLFHNAIFDWPFLRKEGWSYPIPWQTTWDTMVCAWLLDENEPKSLEEQTQFHLGAEGKKRATRQKELQKRLKKIGWVNARVEDIQEYGAGDVRNTFDLYLWQREQISKDASLACALVREHHFLQVCDEMISNGVRVDFEQAHRKLSECDAGIDRLQHAYPDLNFDSPKQLGELLFSDDGWGMAAAAFTSTGQPATDKDTLMQLLPFEPRIQDIFDYRKLRKARSTYYVPLVDRKGRDERVHPWFRPHGTKTGRMSCSDPNAQTLPNPETLPGVKECFVAAEGYTLMEYDLEQAELRVAADYADDYILREHLSSGDVHTATAMAMFGRSDGRYRHTGKTINFSSLYGIGAKKLAGTARRSGLKLTEDEARQYLGQWRNLYHGVSTALQDAKKIAEERPVKLWPIGRYRRFLTHHARFENPKDAFSSVIQGGVGEYVKQLMMELRGSAIEAGCRLVLTVHDSIAYEVPKGSEAGWTETVRKVAAATNPFRIEMPVSAKVWAH